MYKFEKLIEDLKKMGCIITENEIQTIFDQLTDKQKEILVIRYGLEDGYTRTLHEISIEKNLTRERVQQIISTCLRKIFMTTRNSRVS